MTQNVITFCILLVQVITHNILHGFIGCYACRVAAGLLEVLLSDILFSMKIYGVNGGPLNYKQMVVTLADVMIHIHHIK